MQRYSIKVRSEIWDEWYEGASEWYLDSLIASGVVNVGQASQALLTLQWKHSLAPFLYIW